MNDRSENLFSLDPAVAEFVRECELTGRRTILLRNDRAVAALVSWDEYVALRETVELASRPSIAREIELADQQARRNALLLPEDLFVE